MNSGELPVADLGFCKGVVLKPHPVNYMHARANAELRPRAYT